MTSSRTSQLPRTISSIGLSFGICLLKADISTFKGAYEIGVMQTFERKTYACNVQQQLDAS